jgi:serine/threonine protein phosphatase PrpC
MRYKITAAGHSDTGLVRQSNEDAWGQVLEYNFFALADGMGGHLAGEVASREAITSLCHLVPTFKKKMSLTEARDALDRAIRQVNGIVYHLSRADERFKGMGTTLCSIQFRDEGLLYAHVGDSRIYRLRNHVLEQLTLDHSLLRELVDLGQLSEGQVPDFLYKNILTKAIGTEATVEPTVQTSDIQEGDMYLLCSDGLSDALALHELELILNSARTLEGAVKTLIANAKYRGGYDNITAVVMRVEAETTSDEARN